MNDSAQIQQANPTAGIWKRFLMLIPLVVVMTVVSYLYVRSVCDTYQAWTPPSVSVIDFREYGLDDITFSTPGVVEAVSVDHSASGAALVTFKALADGETTVTFGDDTLNTVWNMRFSREVIERHAGRDAREVTVAFSTTNYHVFRGYVCAHEVGMAVEGMGSKTKAYFWPNAFLREFAGLLVKQRWSIIQTYLVLVGIYLFAGYALTLV